MKYFDNFQNKQNTTNVRFTKQINAERLGAKKLALSSVYSTVSALKGVQNTERFLIFFKTTNNRTLYNP